MYITFNKENKKVAYIGEKKPIAYSDSLLLAKVTNIPDKYDYLTAENIQEHKKVEKEGYAISNKEISKISQTYLTCDLVAHFNDNVEESEVELKEKYERLVDKYIREKYSLSNELAILRQANVKTVEFDEYNKYAEECKIKAKSQITLHN